MNNKWCIILGGSQGIGFACAQKMAGKGFNLCIVHRDRRSDKQGIEAKFEDIRRKHETELISFNVDATRQETSQKVVEELRARNAKVHVMLHSIAKGNLKLIAPVKDADLLPKALQNEFKDAEHLLREDDFALTSQAMALSYYSWCKAIFDKELFADKAVCLALSSEGSKKAWRNYAAVSAAKAMLEAISRSLALELAQYGVRSNIIQPGITNTSSLQRIAGSDYLLTQALERNPFGRLTKPEDVANVVYLMSLEEAQWINGVVVPVDGGESIT